MKCLPDKQEDLSLTQEFKWEKRKKKKQTRCKGMHLEFNAEEWRQDSWGFPTSQTRLRNEL